MTHYCLSKIYWYFDEINGTMELTYFVINVKIGLEVNTF